MPNTVNMKEMLIDINTATTNAIIATTGIAQTNCSCKKCVSMCKTAPCIGTPLEMEAIMNAGFGDNLIKTTIAAPIVKETLGIPFITILGIKFDNKKKRCSMLDGDNKCTLHNFGLKPSEGKLADCKRTHAVEGKPSPLQAILMIWNQFNTVNKLN